MPQKKTTPTQLQDLKAENKTLKLELERLRKAATDAHTVAKKKSGNIWKKSGVFISVVMATSLLVAGNLIFWAGNTVIDQQRFSAVVSPLIKTSEVQQAVAHYTTEQLFQRVDVQQILAENLPERIAFAAPVLASQIETATQTALERVMQNESFQQTFNSTIEASHERFVSFVKSSDSDGVVQLSDVYNKLVARLADTPLSFLSQVSLPEQFGSIVLIDATWLPVAHNIVNNIDMYRTLTILLCVAFIALAVWLSERKRRTAIFIGISFAVFMLITLVAVRITQQQIVAGVPVVYQPVAGVVSDGLLSSLILQTRAIFVLGLLVSFVAWIGGPYKTAVSARGRFEMLFGGRVHEALFGTRENALTQWFGQHKRAVQWTLVAAAVLVLVSAPINMSTLLIVTVALIALILILEIIAAPRRAVDDQPK